MTFLKVFSSFFAFDEKGVYVDFRLDVCLFSSVSTHLRQSAVDHLLVRDVVDAENVIAILDLISVHFCKFFERKFLN